MSGDQWLGLSSRGHGQLMDKASHRRRLRHVLTDVSDPIILALDAFSSNTRTRLRDSDNRTRRTRRRARRAT